MTKRLSLTSVSFWQLYSFLTILLYGWFFFAECLNDKILWYGLPIIFIILWQSLFILFSLLLSHRYGKVIGQLLLICNAFVFYFMYAYHTPIDDIMIMNALQTDKAEASELINVKLFLIVFLFGFIPVLCLAFLRIKIDTFKTIIKHIAISLLIIIVSGGIFYRTTNIFLHRFKYNQPYLPPINYLIGTGEVLIKEMTPKPPLRRISTDITPAPIADKPNLIIFIMGETSRAANFSLNGYSRPTNEALTPYLDNIVYYPNTQACGTSTAVSVPCIFSVYDRKHYKIGSEKYTENILDIFKKSGYKIAWLDNDGGCKDVCTRVRYEKPCDAKTCFDDILLENLKQKLEKITDNQLIVLHTRGSHGPSYHLHYDEESNIYQPICTQYDIWNCPQEELINVYDNTIHYVSKFIANTIEILKSLEDKYNPVLIYTSDHGESLNENGIYLHSAPYETAPKGQTEVPMLVWLPKNNAYGYNITCLKNEAIANKHSHDNIFHSLLGLSGIKSEHYQANLDIFAGCK